MNTLSRHRANHRLWACLFAVCFTAVALTAQDVKTAESDTKKLTESEPTTTGPITVIDPEATELLEGMKKAYENLKAAEFAGTIKVNVDIPSEAHQTNQQFTSTFSAPNKFKHQIKNGLLMASNGGEVYIFNEEANSFLRIDIPTIKVEMRSLPTVVPQVLQSQNPSLLFSISKSGVQEVVESFGEIKKAPDTTIDGKVYPGLAFCSDDQESELHLVLDPDTHLIRRFTIDFKPALNKGGITDVENAEVVVDYTAVNVTPEFPENHFAWTPPQGAFDVREAAGAARPEKPKSNMQGVPAPNFKLATLDGRSVSLSHFKGKVVVLDFWATWSPRSAKSLATMADLVDRESDLEIFAVNLEEDKDKVKTFVDLKHIKLPVLLDDGRVAKIYEVKTIPQTIVIGKNGIVEKVFAGDSPDRDQEIEEAIEAARVKK